MLQAKYISTCFLMMILLLLSVSSNAQKRIVVAADGTGDYKTVQAAFDVVPKNNRKPVTIFIKKGRYYEKLWLDSTKNHVTLEGEDKFQTVLTYNDHTGKIAPNGDTINTYTSQTFMIKADHFTAKNISFENNAGFDAGQAVAVHAAGDKLIFINSRFLGFQDVLFTSPATSRQYYQDCYIEGTTDFIFGAATVWFERCHVHSKKNSHVTAASTPIDKKYGFVFHDCVLTADKGLVNVSLGRPWRPYADVTYLNCYIDAHIHAEGWNNWRNPENEKTARFSEFNNYGPGSATTSRLKWTRNKRSADTRLFTLKDVFPDWNPLNKLNR
jgi:pectinesterase